MSLFINERRKDQERKIRKERRAILAEDITLEQARLRSWQPGSIYCQYLECMAGPINSAKDTSEQ